MRRILALGLLVIATVATVAQAQSSRVGITPAAGFTITWDGNNGGFSSPDVAAAPSNNVALASNGAVPIGSSELGFGGRVHWITNINDGFYGNQFSWISANGVGGASDPDPWIGVAFPSSVAMSAIAWGRDNGNDAEGVLTDRTVGVYTLQFTQVPNPDATTPETGDAATGWQSLGTVEYMAGTDSALFASYLRHRFDVRSGGSPVNATAVRIKVSNGGIAIDEIEVNPLPDPVPPIGTYLEVMPAAGFAIDWDRNEGSFSTPASPALVPVNDASASRGAVPFGSSELSAFGHLISEVNDGRYGNANSWISANGVGGTSDPDPFIGVSFGHRLLVRSLALGRDNGDSTEGTSTDRALGVYTIQITTAPNPGRATPDACGPYPDGGWVTIGTLRYKGSHPTFFNPHLRHRFDLSAGGNPIPATGIRIKASNGGIAVDEIEVNANPVLEQNLVAITNAAGFSITWDGNDGHFNDPSPTAGPPDNRALASNGTTPFGSSDLSGFGHRISYVNDGRYGNSSSWISANGVGGTTDTDPFIGLNFSDTVAITNIAWGRDNGNAENYLTDRSVDTYTLQYTTLVNPDETTTDTGDAATGWATIGALRYSRPAPPFFTPNLRHRFDLAGPGGPINATGIRIKVASGGTCIDDIEINTASTAPPPLPPVVLTPAEGYSLSWDGNDGQFHSPAAGAAPPDNRALASNGTTPFGSSELSDFGHLISEVNDGLYGNAFSWISANGVGGSSDPDPFIGLSFGGLVSISNVAWSRDNGDDAEGIFTDRALGIYTLQITTVFGPDATTPETDDRSTGWAALGTVQYSAAAPPDFRPAVRHRFDVASGGSPIEATGLRIKVSNGGIDIDEIEVNTASTVPPPHLSIARSGGDAVITWTGTGGLEFATSATGPWACLGDAVSPYTIALNSGPTRFYRVRR